MGSLCRAVLKGQLEILWSYEGWAAIPTASIESVDFIDVEASEEMKDDLL